MVGKAKKSSDSLTGAETVCFDLSDIYSGIEDPRIKADLKKVGRLAEEFAVEFKGKLHCRLGLALRGLQRISQWLSKLAVLELWLSCDTSNDNLQQIVGLVRESYYQVQMKTLFFDIELSRMAEINYLRQLNSDPFLSKHQRYLDPIRATRKNYLALQTETILARKRKFLVDEWCELMEEAIGEEAVCIRADWLWGASYWGKSTTLRQTDALIEMSNSPDERAEAQRALNRRLKRRVAPKMKRALNSVIGNALDEQELRGYRHPMAEMNGYNAVSQETVDALHESVMTTGRKLMQSYYSLLQRQLGIEKLAWSDRDAQIIDLGKELLPWPQASKLLVQAYKNFSPKLASYIQEALANGWVDAPEKHGKVGYHFNSTLALPRGYGVRSYTLLHYSGSVGDLPYAAHEFGHLAHGMLCGRRNGPLLMESNYISSEVGSIMGEMIFFESMLRKAKTPELKLGLLGLKIKEFLQNVARNIANSRFELRIHEARRQKKLTVKEYCEAWQASVAEVYGPEGEIFSYRDMEYTWAKNLLFLEPFYSHSYAFAELFVQRIFAEKHRMGKRRFVANCLQLLGNSPLKTLDELSKPFGFELETKEDFDEALRLSLGKWISKVKKMLE